MLHLVTYLYPESPTEGNKQQVIALFRTLSTNLPYKCKRCIAHYLDFLKERPIEENCDSRRTLSEWLIDLHNGINLTKRKGVLTYDEVNKKYRHPLMLNRSLIERYGIDVKRHLNGGQLSDLVELGHRLIIAKMIARNEGGGQKETAGQKTAPTEQKPTAIEHEPQERKADPRAKRQDPQDGRSEPQTRRSGPQERKPDTRAKRPDSPDKQSEHEFKGKPRESQVKLRESPDRPTARHGKTHPRVVPRNDDGRPGVRSRNAEPEIREIPEGPGWGNRSDEDANRSDHVSDIEVAPGIVSTPINVDATNDKKDVHGRVASTPVATTNQPSNGMRAQSRLNEVGATQAILQPSVVMKATKTDDVPDPAFQIAQTESHRGEKGKGKINPGIKAVKHLPVFQSVFVIYAEERPDRYDHIRRELRKVGLNNCTFFSTVTPTSRNVQEWNKSYCQHAKRRSGKNFPAYQLSALATLFSHLSIIRESLNRGYQRVMVVEDDVFFVHSPEVLKRHIGEVGNSFDMIYLTVDNQKPPKKISNHFYRIVSGQVASAYIISRPVMEFVNQNITGYDKEIDTFYSERVQPKFNCLYHKPPIVYGSR